MYSICRIRKFDILNLKRVSDILYECGKDMAMKYDLHHWDNSHVKTWLIVMLCALKNNIYLVYNEEKTVATFQTRKVEESLLFKKLAITPALMGGGIGSYCLAEIERIAKEVGCTEVICEVYDKSEHAMSFYEHRGYTIYGAIETFKYKELKMRRKV